MLSYVLSIGGQRMRATVPSSAFSSIVTPSRRYVGPTQRVGVEPRRERLYITSHPPRLIGRAQLRRRRRRGCRAPVDDLGRCEVQTHDRHRRFLRVSTLRPYGAHRLYDHRRHERPAPRLFGQDLKHYDKFNYWEIHVWAWKQNRSGIFADWNPDVTCPKTRPRKT